MKQGKIYYRIVQAIFLVAILAYIGYAVFSAVSDPLTTTTIIEFETGEASLTSGYIVRDETPLYSGFRINVLSVPEGAKVAAGESVAAGYNDTAAQDRQDEIAALRAELEQLQSVNFDTLTAADAGDLDQLIYRRLAALAGAAAAHKPDETAAAAAETKNLLLQRDVALGNSTTGAVDTRISEISARLRELSAQSIQSNRVMQTERSGWVSSAVDGFENVLTPAALASMTLSDFQSLRPQNVPSNAYGKLITSSTWRYVTAVPAEYTSQLRVGQSVSVRFAENHADSFRMKIESLGSETDGQRLLVLSCDKYLTDFTRVRRANAELVFASYSGLRVPKDALRYLAGAPGVYVLDGARAVWKSVEILYDNGESYVVTQDKTSTRNLWAGDAVIVDAKNLYDGKVVN